MIGYQNLDPTRIYRVGNQNCILKTAAVELGTGNNQTVVSAVTGKRIRIMGWDVQGTTSTQPYFYLKNGSGGSLLTTRITAPASTALPWTKEIKDCGYFETTAGTGLFIDIATAALGMNLHYIEYTPPA